MNWEIRIPFHDRADPVGFVGFAARELEDADERAIVREMTLEAIYAGVETAGDLIDSIERRPPEERRVLLDRWRERAGLKTATEIDVAREQRRIDRRFEADDIPGPPRWSPLQACHAPGCSAWPTGPAGNVVEVSVERWFCPQHQDQAQPGDLDEHESPYIGFTSGGRPIPSAKEKARIAAEVRKRDEPRERERRQREELQRREYEATEAARRRWEEQGQVSVLGHRVRPGSVRIID